MTGHGHARVAIASLAAGLALLPAAVVHAAAEPPLESRVAAAAKDYLDGGCRVGLSIVMVRNGNTSFHHFGSVRRDRVRVPTSDTVYELASVTKTFIGALAAHALVEGRLTLDGDFRTALPGRYANLERDGRPVTLRTLATHTSGLPRDLPDTDALMADPDRERIGAQLAALNAGYTRARSLADLAHVTLRSTPGETFAYSNLGIRVIGYGLETVQREALAALLARIVFTPLRMKDTRFAPTATQRARRATPYSRGGAVQPFHDASAGAAYGLYSTPRDMARYLAWQLDEHDPVVAMSHAVIRGDAREGEALIWNVGRDGDRDDGGTMLWHGGGSFGQTSQMVLFPASREGYVLLANDACDGSESALKAIALSLHRR